MLFQSDPSLLFAGFAWVIAAYIGATVLSRYRQIMLGFALCLLFGPLGWIACIIIRRDHERDEDQRWHRELLMAVRGEVPEPPPVMTDPQGRKIETIKN